MNIHNLLNVTRCVLVTGNRQMDGQTDCSIAQSSSHHMSRA